MIGLFKRYYSVYFAQYYIYDMDAPIDEVLAQVRELLTTTRPLLSVPNITGRMTKYSFVAGPAWSFLVISGTSADAASISGKLVETGPAATSIELTVSANWIFILFYAAFNIAGVLCLMSGANGVTPELIGGGLVFILIAHVAPWAGAYFCKKFLRETFEEALGITPQT